MASESSIFWLNKGSESKELWNPYGMIAYISDTHIGSTRIDHPGMSMEEFGHQCENLVHIPASPNIIVLGGDMLDKNAQQEDINHFIEFLNLLKQNGKRVLYVWGNNEEQLQEQYPNLKQVLKESCTKVFDDESEPFILQTNDPQTSEVRPLLAFVGASRVLRHDEQLEVKAQTSSVARVQKNREMLKRRGSLDRFRHALAATVRDGGSIPTVLLFHAPPHLEVYPEEFRQYADREEIQASDDYTKAIIEHQQQYGNICMELFGHVENRSNPYEIPISGRRPIVCYNECSFNTNGQIRVAFAA